MTVVSLEKSDEPIILGVYTTSKRPLKSKICIKQKYRNLLKLRYLRIFEVFLNSFYRVLHAEREALSLELSQAIKSHQSIVI